MNEKKYDLHRLRSDLRNCAETIKALKKHLRTPLYLPTSVEYRELRKLQARATHLCCLRAHHRGRVHLHNGLEQNMQLTYVIHCENEYLLPKTQEAVV